MDGEDEVHGFGQQTAIRLYRMSGQTDEGLYQAAPCTPGELPGALHLTVASTLPAMSGLQMNYGECTEYDCSSTGLLVLSSTTHPKVFNPSNTAISVGKKIVATYNRAGLLVAIVDPC